MFIGYYGVSLAAKRYPPDPPSASAFAVRALVAYFLLGGAAEWIDRRRDWNGETVFGVTPKNGRFPRGK